MTRNRRPRSPPQPTCFICLPSFGQSGTPFVVDTAGSVTQNALLMPLAAVNPSLPLFAMSAIAGANKAAEVSRAGGAPSEAIIRGAVSGGIEAATEKIPLDNFLEMARGTTGGLGVVLKNLLRQVGTEATEEGISYAANYLADKVAGDPNAEFTVQELLAQMAAGGLSGGMFWVGGTGVGAVNQAVGNAREARQVERKTLPRPAEGETRAEVQSQAPVQDMAAVETLPLPADDSTVVDTDPAKHTPQEQAVIEEYQAAVDPGIISFIEKVHGLKNQDYKNRVTYPVSDVTLRAAEDIKNEVGSDASDCTHVISGGAITHIEKSHGKNGKRDQSMRDVNDIARIAYVVNNYDSIELLLDAEGKPRLSNYHNADNSFAPMFRYRKKVNGTYYVVEAAVDSKARELPILSAYIQNNSNGSTDQVLNMPPNGDPQLTADPLHGANASAPNPKIPQSGTGVNPQSMQNGGNDAPVVPTVSPEDSTGAAPLGFDVGARLVEKYGAFEPGENPAPDRVVEVARNDLQGRNVSQTIRTVAEAEATPRDAVGGILNEAMRGRFSYVPIADDAASERAVATIESKGRERALTDWTVAVQKGIVSKDLVSLGWHLYNNAVNAGDSRTAIDVLTDMTTMVRSGAQAVQAVRILKQLAPTDQLYAITRTTQKYADELRERYGDMAPDLTIDERLAQEYLDAQTEEERQRILTEIYKDIARQVPSTFADKARGRFICFLN